MEQVVELQGRNNNLEIELLRLRTNQPAPPPPAAPQPAAPPPAAQPAADRTELMQQLVAAQRDATAAQNEANRLRAQAQPDKLAKSAVTTFPTLRNFQEVAAWYQKLVTLISQPKYRDLYDPLSEDVIPSGAGFPTLNSALYSEILNNSGKEVEAYILAKTHLRNDGVALILHIHSSYNRTWSTLKFKSKKEEWSQMR